MWCLDKEESKQVFKINAERKMLLHYVEDLKMEIAVRDSISVNLIQQLTVKDSLLISQNRTIELMAEEKQNMLDAIKKEKRKQKVKSISNKAAWSAAGAGLFTLLYLLK